jgi:hypothetical protein
MHYDGVSSSTHQKHFLPLFKPIFSNFFDKCFQFHNTQKQEFFFLFFGVRIHQHLLQNAHFANRKSSSKNTQCKPHINPPDKCSYSSSSSTITARKKAIRSNFPFSTWYTALLNTCSISEIADELCSCGNGTTCDSPSHHSVTARVRFSDCKSCSSQCSTQECTFPIIFTKSLLQAISHT